MAFDWSEYLTLAHELARRPGEEAALRSAISRAYYSVYHRAGIRLRQNKVPILPDPLGLHQRQWKVYTDHPDRRCKKIGYDGDRLRESRNRADYDDNIQNVPREAQSAMMLAMGIIGSLLGLPSNLP